jgi:hypothetical protein
MPVPWYDSWKLNPPEPKVVHRCEQCDGEIYEGEEMYRLNDGTIIHTRCFDEYAQDVLNPILEFAE